MERVSPTPSPRHVPRAVAGTGGYRYRSNTWLVGWWHRIKMTVRELVIPFQRNKRSKSVTTAGRPLILTFLRYIEVDSLRASRSARNKVTKRTAMRRWESHQVTTSKLYKLVYCLLIGNNHRPRPIATKNIRRADLPPLPDSTLILNRLKWVELGPRKYPDGLARSSLNKARGSWDAARVESDSIARHETLNRTWWGWQDRPSWQVRLGLWSGRRGTVWRSRGHVGQLRGTAQGGAALHRVSVPPEWLWEECVPRRLSSWAASRTVLTKHQRDRPPQSPATAATRSIRYRPPPHNTRLSGGSGV